MPDLCRGAIDLEIADDFPELQLLYMRVPFADGRTPRAVKNALMEVSSRFRVAHAPALRQSVVPSAYRAFYRQVGLDPDVQRSPLDEAIYQRLLQGAFKSWGHLEDAITVAGMETLVPIWAMDAEGTDGGLGLRAAAPGEALLDAQGVSELEAGALVVADAQGPLAELLAEPPPGRRVDRRTNETIIYTVQPEGVPAVTVREALSVCAQMMMER